MVFKYILNWFRPKTVAQAVTAKKRLAIVYGFIGWNSFIIVYYLHWKDKNAVDFEGRKAAILEHAAGRNLQTIRLNKFTVVESKLYEAKEKSDSKSFANQ